jgi:hypothetical protein
MVSKTQTVVIPSGQRFLMEDALIYRYHFKPYSVESKKLSIDKAVGTCGHFCKSQII